MSEAEARIGLRSRETYLSWHDEKLRSYDMDAQRHINNNVLASLCEEGRRAFLRENVLPLLEPGTMVMIARYGIEFLREVSYPGMVDIGTGLLRCGNSSITLGHAIFAGDACCVTSDAVVVFADPQTRRGRPLPPAAREVLAKFEISGRETI
jgi:acyl-CoA thioester hydrolase